MRTLKLLSALVFALLLGVGTASADPITFTFTGTGSGNLNGNAFTDAAFTITGVGDTSNLQSCGGTCSFIDFSSNSFVADFGSGTFNDGLRAFNVAGNGTAGLSMAGLFGNDLIDFSNSSLVGYGLTTSIGPLAGSGIFAVYQFSGIGTSIGSLTFDSVSSINFQASTAVPEPGMMMLFASGLVGLGTRLRRKA